MKALTIFILKTYCKGNWLLLLTLFLGQDFSAQSLEELKQISAEQNLELKAQYKRFEAELESIQMAKPWQDPNLSFGYFISPIETRVGPQVARFSLSQMLPWFGTLKAKGEVATHKAEAQFQQFQDKKLQLYLEVAEQYYELSALEYQISLETTQLSILEDLKATVQSHYENNKAQLIDIYRIGLDIDKQRNAIDVLVKQKAMSLISLNQLLNRPVDQPVLIENPKQILETVRLTAVDSFSVQHPRIERLQSLKNSAESNMILAQKQNMPQLGVGLDYVIIQDKNVMNADAGQDAVMPMLSISLPIFGQKNKSRKKVAELMASSVDFELQNEVQSIKSKARIASFKNDELIAVLGLYDEQLNDLEDMVQLTETALANGSIAIEEILDLQTEKLLIEKLRVKTLAELHKNQEVIKYFAQNSE
jgi:outer membrane protein TolC